MIHIKDYLQETTLLDVKAIDTKLAKWQRRSDWRRRMLLVGKDIAGQENVKEKADSVPRNVVFCWYYAHQQNTDVSP